MRSDRSPDPTIDFRADASALYARNVLDFLKLLLPPAAKGEPPASFRIDMEDDIVAACLMAHEGAVTRK